MKNEPYTGDGTAWFFIGDPDGVFGPYNSRLEAVFGIVSREESSWIAAQILHIWGLSKDRG